MGSVSQDSQPRKSILGKEGKLGSNHAGTWFGKERFHREGLLESVNLMSVVFARLSLRRGHKRKLCNKKDAPAKQHWIWRTILNKPKNSDKAPFKELSSEDMDTVKRSRTLTVVLTANGEVHTNEEAQVYVHDLNLFVTVQ